jgi:hypothetical protein
MLTTAQAATVKAAILADGALAPLTSGPGTDYAAIAAAMSADAAPAFVVWRSVFTPAQSRKAIVSAITQLDNLTVGKRDALLYMVADNINSTDAASRQALDDLCGTQNTLKAALLAAQKRNATRIEKVLATGTGSDAVPATATYEGGLSLGDVAAMFNA